MSRLPSNVRLTVAPHTTAGTVYDECTRCGRKTKTYRKITWHLQRCAT
jgi:ribosomal protein S14